jgi:mono/diheme cytochrome c family protein
MVVQRGFKKPPSFHEARLKAASVSHFFNVITNGIGMMSGYAAQIPPEDRWAIIAYVKTLQLSQDARISDVPEAERGKLEAMK